MLEHYNTKTLLEHIKTMYEKLRPIAQRDGVYISPENDFDENIPNGNDAYFCFSDKNGYHYGINERGEVIKHITTKSLVEITYLVLSSKVFLMAGTYKCKNRVDGRDFRRLLFKKELEYWNVLGPEYVTLASQKINDSLRKAPYID